PRLGAQIGYLQDGTRISGRCEETDNSQFSRKPSVTSEGLHADIIEIGSPVHDGLGVRLRDDQRFRPMKKCADFRRGGGDRIVSAPQDADLGIGENAETLFVGALEDSLLLATAIGEFA